MAIIGGQEIKIYYKTRQKDAFTALMSVLVAKNDSTEAA